MLEQLLPGDNEDMIIKIHLTEGSRVQRTVE